MSSTSSEYPESFDTFETPNTGDKVNDVVKSHSNLHKKVNSAIEAIQAALGTNPQGAYSSLTERMGVTYVNSPAVQSINEQTGTSYTLAGSDATKLVKLSNAGAITLTVPPNASVAFAIGAYVDLVQWGTGAVTVAPGSGVTIRATPSTTFRTQYSGATLVKMATNEWLLVGDLA